MARRAQPPPTGPVSPAEYARMVADQMSEATLQAQVERLGDELGWRNYHTKDSRGSKRGFLDWTAIRGPRLIFAELKIQSESRGKATPEQLAWIADLRAFAELVAAATAELEHQDARAILPRVEVYLWRPIDITTDTIARILR